VRNKIQAMKIDMANEVIDAGRFDMQTSMAERRETLEQMLQVPSLQKLRWQAPCDVCVYAHFRSHTSHTLTIHQMHINMGCTHSLKRVLPQWQDEDRLKQAVNTTPDHAALNAMLARGPEEVALFQSLDAQPVGVSSVPAPAHHSHALSMQPPSLSQHGQACQGAWNTPMPVRLQPVHTCHCMPPVVS
jgi:hypothetical protein